MGEDQIQHVELCREIARKFNARFGETFPEPKVILSDAPRILGTDGNAKMSKSLNNAIGLLDPPEMVWEKLRTAVTDVKRQRRSDPGNPDKCNIFTMHQAFSKSDQRTWIDQNCRTAGMGCIECKEILFKNMMGEIGPIQARVNEINQRPQYMVEVLKSGAERCKGIVRGVMEEVRRKIGVTPPWMER